MYYLITQVAAFVLNLDVPVIFMRKEGTLHTRKESGRIVEQLCRNWEHQVCCKTPFLCETVFR